MLQKYSICEIEYSLLLTNVKINNEVSKVKTCNSHSPYDVKYIVQLTLLFILGGEAKYVLNYSL